jgi:hypothetical protein
MKFWRDFLVIVAVAVALSFILASAGPLLHSWTRFLERALP